MPGPTKIPALSDHAYQSTTFQTINPATDQIQTQLNVGSWNLQDMCRSQATQGNHANNPWDADEDRPNFEARKRKQIEKIEAKIKNGGDDIVFLQEIDFLLGAANKRLQNEFKAMLLRNGYELALSQKPGDPNFSQQPMATIYNAQKLQLQNTKGVLPAPPDARGIRKYRGYETTFSLKTAPFTPIVATNLHLLYGHDYKSEIEDYQKKQERTGVFSIMGGDTNNVQNENLNTALGNWHNPTNVSRDHNTGQLTTSHRDPQNPASSKQKAYDRFFGVPSSGCYLRAQASLRSEHVFIKNGEAKFRPINDNEQFRRVSISRVGERWRRGNDIIHELEQKYFTAPNIIQQNKLLKEMHQVIQWKKLDTQTCFSNPAIRAAYGQIKAIHDNQNKKRFYEHYIDPANRQSHFGRDHFFKAATISSNLQGDALKSQILDKFYTKIERCTSNKQLENEIKKIKKSPDYELLATGQGLVTRLSGGLIKTSSIIAFEQFCAEKKIELSPRTPSNTG